MSVIGYTVLLVEPGKWEAAPLGSSEPSIKVIRGYGTTPQEAVEDAHVGVQMQETILCYERERREGRA